MKNKLHTWPVPEIAATFLKSNFSFFNFPKHRSMALTHNKVGTVTVNLSSAIIAPPKQNELHHSLYNWYTFITYPLF